VSEYEGFSINEIDAMYATEQLDMLMEKQDKDLNVSKVYVNYFLKGNLTDSSLRPIVEDLYQLSDTLSTGDTLIVIYDGEPTDSLHSNLDHLFKKDKIFVVVLNIKRLQFNILEHFLVPRMRILNEFEQEDLFKQYNISHPSQLPEISRYDPQALVMCMRPGQVCQITRKSPTSMNSTYYRICV
jgi:DNA-directed RNA polymerase subunit H (RpoH/RPB5)